MPRFLALTSRGLNEVLGEELTQLGIKRPKVRGDAVEFESSWAELYRLHLSSRLATRFFLPVADFRAYNGEDLYHGIMRKHDYTKHIDLDQTLRVEAHVRDSRELRDQRFVAMKVKDAVCDQFREKFDARPNVGDEVTAALRIVVRVVETEVSVSLDLTGDPLSNRGYRQATGGAPLRENVAAGLLRMAGWTPPRPLVDPFCGSGTILIEAALQALGASTAKRRRAFAFEKLKGFDAGVWAELNGAPKRRASPAQPFLFGYDVDPMVLDKARENARAAGVENWIRFQRRDVRDLVAPAGVEGGVVITNPPYGERMSTAAQVGELMDTFARQLKHGFTGWDAWVLSGDPRQSAAMRLKASRRVPVWNGPIECRLLKYEMR